ncbi:phosphoserine phosphatase SerB [Desertihabitans brevis]|uniref:phosphoserine phosphatase SerB n=1 Tax=Desertihabitans brevis TaxID=2268447 RepID=UPI001F3A31EA|nr:phosphoserine phosphatase SerB [Desertihabitans brevis]
MTPLRIVLVRPRPADPAAAADLVRRALPGAVDAGTRERGDLVSVELTAQAEDVVGLRTRLAEVLTGSGWDSAVLVPPLPEGAGLLVLDVDSTLITAEVIELLAEHAGTREEVAAVTERAMRGELDFAASLHARVATLQGVPVTALADVLQHLRLSPGTSDLIARAREHGATIGLVSGGFIEVVQPLAQLLGITHVRANQLEVADGRLTGRVLGEVVDRAVKAATLEQWAGELGVPLEACVAIGDGANDLDMLAAAGLGIAYCAKPVVAAAADAAITVPRLDVAAELLRW